MGDSGLWMTQSENLTFAQNFIGLSQRTADACSNHIDIASDYNIFEHNISWKNEGGFFESMGLADSNLVRYCVSVDDGQDDPANGARVNISNEIFLTGYTRFHGRIAPTNINVHNNLVVSTNSANQAWTIMDGPQAVEFSNNEWIVGDGDIELTNSPSDYDKTQITAYSNLVGGSADAKANFDNLLTPSDTAQLAVDSSTSYAQSISDVVTEYVTNIGASMLNYDDLKDLICAVLVPADVKTVKEAMTAHAVGYPLFVDGDTYAGTDAQTLDFCGKTIASDFIGAIQHCPSQHHCATCNGFDANSCLTCIEFYERSDDSATTSTCIRNEYLIDCSVSADAFQTTLESIADEDVSEKKLKVISGATCNILLADASEPITLDKVEKLEITCWDTSLDTPAECTGTTKAVVQAVDSTGAASTYEIGLLFKSCQKITVTGMSFNGFSVKHEAQTANIYHTDFTYTGCHFEGSPIAALTFYWWQNQQWLKAYERITIQSCTFKAFNHHGLQIVSWPTDGDLDENKDVYWYSKDITITDNHFYDVWTDHITAEEAAEIDAAGIVLNRCKNVEARKNTFMRMGDSGFWMTQSENVTFAQNFIAQSRRSADACANHIDIASDYNIFEHNISWKNEGGFFESMGLADSNVVRYCISVDDGQDDPANGARVNISNEIFLTGYTASHGRIAPTNINVHNNLVVSTNSANQAWTIMDSPQAAEFSNNEWIVGDGDIELTNDPNDYERAQITAYSNLVGGSSDAMTNFDDILTASDTAQLAVDASTNYAQSISDVITTYLASTDGDMLNYDDLKDLICAVVIPADVTTIKETMTARAVGYPLFVDGDTYAGTDAQTKDFCDQTISSDFIGAVQPCPSANNCSTCSGTEANECLACLEGHTRSDTDTATSTCVALQCTVLQNTVCEESESEGCVWTSDQLDTPNELCLQYMYPYCCANLSECSGLSNLNLDIECPNINVVPTKAYFTNNTMLVLITMSATVTWDPIQAELEATGTNWVVPTQIISAILKKKVDNSGMITYEEQVFGEDMRCFRNEDDYAELRCEFELD